MRIDEPSTRDDYPMLAVASSAEWRAWLETNGRTARGVSLVIRHKTSETPGIHFHQAIEDALCYGWADGRASRRDIDSFHLTFSPRPVDGVWDRISRERAEGLIDRGLMREPGLAAIRLARSAGNWETAAGAFPASLPVDLRQEFDKNRVAYRNFERLPTPSRRLILDWISRAGQQQTRQRRIEQAVAMAEGVAGNTGTSASS